MKNEFKKIYKKINHLSIFGWAMLFSRPLLGRIVFFLTFYVFGSCFKTLAVIPVSHFVVGADFCFWLSGWHDRAGEGRNNDESGQVVREDDEAGQRDTGSFRPHLSSYHQTKRTAHKKGDCTVRNTNEVWQLVFLTSRTRPAWVARTLLRNEPSLFCRHC